MKQGLITWVSPWELKEGGASQALYSTPENYETLKENISRVGILTPLHVLEGVVVSGNLRLRIAKELKLDLVPVIYVSPQKVSDKLLAVSYAQHREKKYSELLAEYEILESEYPIGKGCRTDLNPEKRKNKEKREVLQISKDKLVKLKRIKSLAAKLYGVNTDEYNKLWREVDDERVSLNRALKCLKREKGIRENLIILPEHFDLVTDKAMVFNKSCINMSEIESGTIACVITSPPYFQMRDYGTGESQRGLELDIDSYILGLVSDFRDCFRVLRDDGSLWVNLGEPVLEGQYNAIPHRFVIEMMKAGWIFNDELIWAKNNPVFTQAKRSVRSHEYFFHFVKSKSYHYDVTWLTSLTDPSDLISYGTSANISNLISAMDFRGSIIRTNSNNMEGLRKECTENGFYLTHNAAFPITIPLIAILTTSKVGDTILDIFSGTGTSGEAALATKRKYVGYEIKPEFVKASEVRLEKYLNSDSFEFVSDAA